MTGDRTAVASKQPGLSRAASLLYRAVRCLREAGGDPCLSARDRAVLCIAARFAERVADRAAENRDRLLGRKRPRTRA